MSEQIRIVLEGVDQARSVIRGVNTELSRMSSTAQVSNQAMATHIATWDATSKRFVAVGGAAGKAASGLTTMSQGISAARQGMQALNGLTAVGMMAFPQLSGTIMITTSALSGLRSAAMATGASLTAVTGIAAGLAAAIWAGVEAFRALKAIQDEKDTVEALAEQNEKLAVSISKVSEEAWRAGDITEEEFLRIHASLKATMNDIKDLGLQSQTLKEIGRGLHEMIPMNVIEGLNHELVDLKQHLDLLTAYDDKYDVDRTVNLEEQAVAYEELARAIAKKQAALNLAPGTEKTNAKWIKLEEEYTQALVQSAQARREIRNEERAEIEKQMAIEAERLRRKRQAEDSIVSLMGSTAEAAKMFGREGFIAYKAMAIAQAIVATALAVSRALGEGGPYAGPFMAAAAAAAGAVQIATIATTGYAKGGYTGSGGKDHVAGVVHGGEFVMSKPSVDLLGLDFLQRLHSSALGGISSPGMPAYLAAPVQSLPGYSAGGLVAAPAGRTNINMALVDDRQTRREWAERRGRRVMLSMLAKSGMKVSA